MSAYCDCANLPTEIVDIPLFDCDFDIGQIFKIVLQRYYSTGSTRNGFTVATASPTALASWTALLDAEDSTKVVQSPELGSPIITPGEELVFGGGNETPGGIELSLGEGQSAFTGRFLQKNPATILAMRRYKCENIAAYFVNWDGKIFGEMNEAGTIFMPIKLYSWRLGNRAVNGRGTPDHNDLSFKLAPGWDDRLAAYVPADFNAKTDLVAS